MKVALVHDYLCEYGEAERLLNVLHRMYPQAPVYTAFIDYTRLGKDSDRFSGWDIRTTWAKKLPAIARYPFAYRFLLPYIWESLDLSEYDLVISSSGNYLCKAVLTNPSTLHVSYCHTPPRYLWETSHQIPPRWYHTWLDSSLRRYDFLAAQRVDCFITNSETAARRIQKFYRRSAEVIPPPVAVRGDGQAGERYYLYVGSLERSQQVNLAVEACTRMERPLVVVGQGEEAMRLQRLAGNTVRFLTDVATEEMPKIYANAKALIYPCSEADFATAPVEAMGYGVPVIAAAQSGIREVVLDYRTGLLFSQATVGGLCEAIVHFEGLRFFSAACIQRAEEFAEPVFISKLQWSIAQAMDDYRAHGWRYDADLATHPVK